MNALLAAAVAFTIATCVVYWATRDWAIGGAPEPSTPVQAAVEPAVDRTHRLHRHGDGRTDLRLPYPGLQEDETPGTTGDRTFGSAAEITVRPPDLPAFVPTAVTGLTLSSHTWVRLLVLKADWGRRSQRPPHTSFRFASTTGTSPTRQRAL